MKRSAASGSYSLADLVMRLLVNPLARSDGRLGGKLKVLARLCARATKEEVVEGSGGDPAATVDLGGVPPEFFKIRLWRIVLE